MPYIDDCNSVGTSDSGVNKATEELGAALASHGLPIAEHKTQWASASGRPASALGLWWWPSGVLTPRPAMVRRLRWQTERVISRRGAQVCELRSLIGAWVWCCLLRRGALSILDTLFEVSDKETLSPLQFYRLRAGQLDELHTLLDVMPLLFADLRVPQSSRLYASDASRSGGGVVYCDLPDGRMERAQAVLSETRITSGWYTSLFLSAGPAPLQAAGGPRQISTSDRVSPAFSAFLSGCNFRVAISTAWRVRTQYINLLEMEAVKLALRHMGRSSVTREKRVQLLVDNTGVLGALGKGRSASTALNRLCRQVFALTSRLGLSLELYWAPSDLNPADFPSRHHYGRVNSLRRSQHTGTPGGNLVASPTRPQL